MYPRWYDASLLKYFLFVYKSFYRNVTLCKCSVLATFITLVVGVNGVGKTTTIGKLAHHFKAAGNEVLLGAADTFRAAAVDQLTIWSERVGVPIVKQNMGADPSSVAFDTVQSAIARKSDIVFIDTAGRLHNKAHLMDELNKIKRVIQKQLPSALLVYINRSWYFMKKQCLK